RSQRRDRRGWVALEISGMGRSRCRAAWGGRGSAPRSDALGPTLSTVAHPHFIVFSRTCRLPHALQLDASFADERAHGRMDCATIAAMFRLRCLSLALSGLLLFCLAGSAHAREKRTRYVELQPMVGWSWVNLTGFSESRFVAVIDPSNVAPGTSCDDVANQHFDDGQVPVDGSGVSFGAALQLKLWVY